MAREQWGYKPPKIDAMVRMILAFYEGPILWDVVLV
jgi:hypothetical protein